MIVGNKFVPLPPPPIQTSVNFRDFDHEKPYFFKISTNTLKLGNLTNLKATFLAELKDFPWLVFVISWKKPWKSLLTIARKMPGEGRSMSQGWDLKLTEHYFIFHQLHFDSRFTKDISSFNILELSSKGLWSWSSFAGTWTGYYY